MVIDQSSLSFMLLFYFKQFVYLMHGLRKKVLERLHMLIHVAGTLFAITIFAIDLSTVRRSHTD